VHRLKVGPGRADAQTVRDARAFVGALGAGVSLAIASSVALLVVSSVVAFRGWPDDLSGTQAPRIARLSEPATVTTSTVAKAAAVVLPAARRPATSRTAVGSRGVSTNGTTTSTPAAGNGGTGGGSGPSGGGTPAGPTTLPAGETLKTTVSAPVHRAGDTVVATSEAVGQVVAPLSPQASTALQSVGASGGDAVDKVADAVDKVLP